MASQVCIMDFDEVTNTVTIRNRKYGTIQMTVKLEAAGTGTMRRIAPEFDCDNFWVAFKPADSEVFQEGLFSKKQVTVKKVDWTLE